MAKSLVLESKIMNYNFMDDIHYDYDYETNCDESCEDEGICRCAEIVNFLVNSWKIDVVSLINNIFSNSKEKYYNSNREIFSVVLENFLIDYLDNNSINDMFDPNIQSGYYGEELMSINLVDKELSKKLVELASLNDEELEKVNYGS